ncbi:hypothetical protein C8F04DRAFT_1270749 [Mycena alexandri]|uniref:SNTX MACPF/CDC-like domain-containing protein n=1 Tax=Mycena alexandri TaxID=1745969 RepID=A0AAD6SAM9_9AGAR|nr:hypothetical protein C8F04DRAFT_1270749 [Mycena alexandri]
MQDTLEVNALGRPCELGQLYDIRNGRFLPGLFLFRPALIQPRVASAKRTKSCILEVKNFSDRSATLDISPTVSLDILCGTITATSTASYLSTSQDTAVSTTLAGVTKLRTSTKSFDILELMDNPGITSEKVLLALNATHVVTSITYGGNMVATLAATGKPSLKEGKMSAAGALEAIEGFKSIFTVGTTATIDSLEREKLGSSNLEVRLEADICLGDEGEMPTDPLAMIQLLKRSHTLVGEGIPCEVCLLPLQGLGYSLPTFRELAEADLNSLLDTYNRIFLLDSNRKWLCHAVESQRASFPTFAAHAHARSAAVTKLVHVARDRLRKYVHQYRSANDGVEKAADFIESTNAVFEAATREYAEDRNSWQIFEDYLSIAKSRGVPFFQVCDIARNMDYVVGTNVLAVVLVPEEVEWVPMVAFYRDARGELHKRRQSIEQGMANEGAVAGKTKWMSIYLDPLCDETLLRFDDRVGAVKTAVQLARHVAQI